MGALRDRARDPLVTGMGFCLPGTDGLTATPDDFWDIVSTGRVLIDRGDRWFGVIEADPLAEAADRWPDVPLRHLANCSTVQLYALISAAEACRDSGLSPEGGDLAGAGLLHGRHCLDANAVVQRNALSADPAATAPEDARRLVTRTMVGGQLNDTALAQMSALRTTGPCLTVTASCASGGVLFGIARRMITDGEADVVLVTGADHYDTGRRDRFDAVAARAAEGLDLTGSVGVTARMMRPYDHRTGGLNVGNGAATVVVESREHAEAGGRADRARAELLGQSTRRSPMRSTMAVDEAGEGVSRAVLACLSGRLEPDRVDYVNGGAEGSPVFHPMESAALRTVFGDRAAELPVSVQEACFGHSGSPLGPMGVAAVALMMRHGRICPTAACEEPDPACVFDPVADGTARELTVDHALSLNYGSGMVSSAILLGRAR
ncbi:beta-ketoacyl synthase N-terminal-like domain-containing protein [Streptomyces sp. YIM 98790]|uniref:beta-ketoacyl synthase N-terminal-like domain-containing protein n=1 Tax=Streptomyces sp. YIM 98790 TaxID=2689077 RepID=UPI00140BB14D|nr:beta-ketoacyl synthase N-terminal-like domain-containing protein [Streptomyces sp. YIM 98790]